MEQLLKRVLLRGLRCVVRFPVLAVRRARDGFRHGHSLRDLLGTVLKQLTLSHDLNRDQMRAPSRPKFVVRAIAVGRCATEVNDVLQAALGLRGDDPLVADVFDLHGRREQQRPVFSIQKFPVLHGRFPFRMRRDGLKCPARGIRAVHA